MYKALLDFQCDIHWKIRTKVIIILFSALGKCILTSEVKGAAPLCNLSI